MSHPVATPQPAPIPNDGPSIHDLVVERLGNTHPLSPLILARKEMGLQKYGTILQANNGRDALMDVLQELLDSIVYAEQRLREGFPGRHHAMASLFWDLVSCAVRVVALMDTARGRG